ncbi:MAG: leucine-rich repeat protein [Marinilabiliaceae bacterium]|nr:leucine-rich repeat protein [Marinilabiliaceae bacterium]
MKNKLLLTLALWLTLLGSAWAQSNNALHFSYSTKNRVDIGAFAAGSPNFSQGFTFAGWVKFDQFKDLARVFTFAPSQADGSNNLMLSASGTTGLIMAEVNVDKVTTTTPLQTNKWYFLTLTVTSGGVTTIYVDGVSAASKTLTAPANIARNTCYLGNSSYDEARGLNGSLDEVSIWSRALSAAEIAGIMNGISSPTTQTGLLAYYTFNQGTAGGINTSVTTLTDATTNAKHGTLKDYTLSGTTSNWVAGYTSPTTNNALYFDGNVDYVSCPATNPTQFTVEAWVYPTQLGRDQAVISTLYVDGNKGMELHIGPDNLPIITINSNGTFTDVKGTNTIAANTWTHLAATYNGTTVKLYVNGAEAKSENHSSYRNGTAQVNIGKRYNESAAYYYSGRIDEVRIWSAARSQTDIAAAKDNPLTGTEANLLAYYTFNQGTAGGSNTGITTLTDATANAKHGTLYSFNLTGATSNWVEGYTPTQTLSATPTTLTLGATSGSNGTVAITSNTNWSIAGIPAWLQASQTTGSGNATVTFTALSNNTTGAERTAELSLTGDGVSQPLTVTVTQELFVPILSATPTTLDLAGTVGSNGTVNITSNTAWTISGNPDWLHVSATTGSGNATVTFTAISELQQPQRTATLTLTGTGIAEPITLTVSQTSDNALHFDGTNDYVQCPAINPETMTIEAWVYLTETGREQVLFSTLNRTAKTGLELVIDANNKLYALGGTGTGIQIFSKETISPLEMNTWVHIAVNVNNSNGKANATVYINANSNPLGITMYSYKQGNNNLILGCSADNGTPNRFFSGKMDEIRVWNKYRSEPELYKNMNKTLTGTEEGLLAYFKCNQGVAYANNSTVTTLTDATAAGNNGTLHGFALSGITSNWVERHATFKLTAQPAELTLPYTQGSSGTVAITSNTNWSIAGIPTWLQAGQTTGSGTVSLTFTTLSDNTTGAERTAELSITGEGISQPVTITVTQETLSIKVSKTELTLACHNGSSDIINITSDIDWQISNIPNWLQAGQTTGSGNASVTFTTKEWNTDAAPRSASLTLSGTGVSQPVTLTATQSGYVPIALSHSTVVLGGNVGNSQHITITTNKAWEHSKNADWLTVTPGTGNGSAGITLSATAANTDSDARNADVEFYTADNDRVTLRVYQAPSTATLSAIITKTDGTQYSALNAGSLCHAIGNTPLEQVKGIEVTGGKFPIYEWLWLQDNRSRITALTRFTITEGVTEVANLRNVFRVIFNSNIEHVSIHGITAIKNTEFQNFAALSYVNFPMATSIDGRAFDGCTALSTANLPMVTSIGYYAFNGCTSLGSIDFPLVTSIEQNAFQGCTNLSSANFPLTNSIGNAVFYGCTSLSSANFPNLTYIENVVFKGCTALSFANFPKATSIDNLAFDGCTSLGNMVLGAVPPATIGYEVFNNCPASRNLSIANATGSELTAAYAAYKAAPDGNTTDNLWYGWVIESSTTRQTISAASVFADGGHTLSPVGLMPLGVTIPLSVVPAAGYRMVPGSLAVHKTGDPSITVPVINGAITMPAYDITVTAAFEQQEYAIITSVANGTITTSHGIKAAAGDIVVLTVTPNTGFKIKSGSLIAHKFDDKSVVINITESADGSLHLVMPAYPILIDVLLEGLPQKLTLSQIGKGILTATPTEGIISMSYIKVTATPAEGYALASLRGHKTDNHNIYFDITEGRFNMPTYDVTVIAEFVALPQELTLAAVSNGTIAAIPNEKIVTDTEISISTIPAAGYKLVENSLSAYKTGNESVTVDIVNGKITMPAYAVTVTAQFEALPQVLTVEAVNNGTITATPSEGIVTGTEITFSTTPAAGYKIVENSLRAYKTSDENVTVEISVTTDGRLALLMPAFDITVTAEFEGLPQVLTLEAVNNGTITATPNDGIVTGAEIALTATPNAGYKLVENSLRAYKTSDESVIVDVVDGKIIMPAYDVAVTAQFELQPYTVSVDANIVNGTLAATPSENVTMGTEVTLTVTPTTGYQLVENSLRAYKTGDETVTVTIVDNKFAMPAFAVTVTAEFEGLPQVLAIATVANGTITATPSEGIVTDTEITLSTTPANGYKLVENSLRAYKTGDETVKVVVVDGKITMPPFDVTVAAEFSTLTGVNNIGALNFSLSPNPATTHVALHATAPVSRVQFVNAAGQTVLTHDAPTGSMAIGSLKPGVYLVKVISTNGQVDVLRLVKQ